MSYHSRRILTPGASKKRKEREALSYSMKPSSASAQPASSLVEPISSNRLLAGYMAFEFLTEGTLLGQKFDPARAEAMSLAGGSGECSKRAEPGKKKEHKSYAEVASILKSEGAHIPGIVNPCQLARWIQIRVSLEMASDLSQKQDEPEINGASTKVSSAS
ncbi:hypothetical protein OIU78_004378 [Salix suchowensis]|nr:hypothetical protein OIU78_004378 [Salix suchowensis]